MGRIDMPGGPGFAAPQAPAGAVEVTRGFSWVSYQKDIDEQRWDNDTKTVTFNAPGVIGADMGPIYRSEIDGQYHVEVDGNDTLFGQDQCDVPFSGEGDDLPRGDHDVPLKLRLNWTDLDPHPRRVTPACARAAVNDSAVKVGSAV
jgi:hypothetical protein